MKALINFRPKGMTFVKCLIITTIFAFTSVISTGCVAVTILPQWRPALKISDSASGPPIIVQSGSERFILFGNEVLDAGHELFLQRMDAAGNLVGSPVRLTYNAWLIEAWTRMVELNGWLYIVWSHARYDGGDRPIVWTKVNTATLQSVAQVEVSAGLNGFNTEPDLAVRPDGTSVVVWKRISSPSAIYYRQVNSNGTLSSGFVTVSQGCSAPEPHLSPRVTRSSGGGYSQVAWVGSDGALYWREINNVTNAPSSGCFNLSAGASYSGQVGAFDMAINPANNDSYLAWTYWNQGSGDADIYYRRVKYMPSASPCQLRLLSNANRDTKDSMVRIAAGHAADNWVHLVWHHKPLSGPDRRESIRYALVRDTDCSANPTAIVATLYTAGSAYEFLDEMQIAAARNAIIARVNATGSTTMSTLAERGGSTQTKPGDDSILKPASDHPIAAAGEVRAPEAEHAPTPDSDCAANPSHPRCADNAIETMPMTVLSGQAGSAGLVSRCGTYGADAVLFSFYSSSDGLYAGLFQVAEVIDPSTNSCVRAISALYPEQGGIRLQRLHPSEDGEVHFSFISARGLPTIAWYGDEGLYVAEAKFPAHLPIVRR
ncbi:MAG: hypothetical protein NZM18_07575 [Thermoflexales bacterium]|nr:hypothetical protein [Thermoflexales bacterium]MDW8350762.1 hypothetical protein [Anaerolineae bacterium]